MRLPVSTNIASFHQRCSHIPTVLAMCISRGKKLLHKFAAAHGGMHGDSIRALSRSVLPLVAVRYIFWIACCHMQGNPVEYSMQGSQRGYTLGGLLSRHFQFWQFEVRP